MSAASFTAMIAIAPVTTNERINDPTWRADRQMYDASGLRLIPGRTANVLVNHDADQVIGTVDSLMRIEDTNGPWLAAVATLHRCPEWLNTRYTRASFALMAGRTSHTFGREIVRGGFVDEVSLLTADREPVEPSARLLTLHPKEERSRQPVAPARAIRRAAPIPEDHERIELLRRLDWHEKHSTGLGFEEILAAMQREFETPRGWRALRLAG